MLAAHAVLRLRRDPLERRAAEPADEVEVVRREVLDHADVADAVRVGADALGRDQEDLPELACPDAAAQLQQRRVEALDVPHRRAHAAARAGLGDRAGLVRARGERLLDQQVDTGGGQLARDRQVLLGGHGHDGEVERPGRQELSRRAEYAAWVVHDAETIAPGVDGARELDAVHLLEQPRVVPADHPEPEDGAAEARGGVRGRHEGH